MWALPEGAAELTAEVRRRKVRGTSERRDFERIAVAGIDQILGAKQVAGWVERDGHRTMF